MKRTIVLFFCIMAFMACEQKKHGAFVVAGKITNAPEQKIYLQEIPFTGEPPVVLDSTTLKKSGNFELRAMAREEGIYRIVLEKGNAVLFVNDDNRIRLRLDANNYRNYVIEGSEASNQLHILLERLYRTDSTYHAKRLKLDTARTAFSDSLVTQEAKHMEDILAQRRKLLKDFINKSNSPAAISYALGQFDALTPATELKQLSDAAASKFPEHSGIARIRGIYTLQVAPTQATGYSLMNQQAPEISMPTPTGEMLSLSNLKGKYVLVDFWASWCAPCREENPNIVAAYNKFKDKNFTILGVSLDRDKDKWVDAISKDNLTWQHISDLKYWNSAAVTLYQFEGIPFNVLVDPQGKIIASDLRGANLEKKLSSVLN